ncbi:hypothetical protein [Singulisphaera sp. PoT]
MSRVSPRQQSTRGTDTRIRHATPARAAGIIMDGSRDSGPGT